MESVLAAVDPVLSDCLTRFDVFDEFIRFIGDSPQHHLGWANVFVGWLEVIRLELDLLSFSRLSVHYPQSFMLLISLSFISLKLLSCCLISVQFWFWTWILLENNFE